MCRGSEWVWRWKGVVVVYVDGVACLFWAWRGWHQTLLPEGQDRNRRPTVASATPDFFEKREMTKTDRKIDGARIL